MFWETLIFFIGIVTAVSTVMMSGISQQQQQGSGPCINRSLDLALGSRQ